MRKLILGIIVSALFVYLSVRGVDLGVVKRHFDGGNYSVLLLVIPILIAAFVLRAIRLGIILSPIEKISQKKLVPITCTGNMFTILIPMRLGELVRAYLVTSKSQVPLSSSLAAVFMEKLFDISSLFLILLLVVFSFDLPAWALNTAFVVLAIFLLILSGVLFLFFRRETGVKIVRSMPGRIPDHVRHKIERFVANFITGFAVLGNPGRIGSIFTLSILIWILSGIGFYPFVRFIDLGLPLISIFVLLIFIALGISIPTAPGYLGNYQFSCILALSLFGISKDSALAFSIITYVVGTGLNIVFGLIFLPSMSFSMRDVRESMKNL